MSRLLQAKQEVNHHLQLRDDELIVVDEEFISFKSIEFPLIVYWTNAEIYYLSDQDERYRQLADRVEDTEKGRIYCFN